MPLAGSVDVPRRFFTPPPVPMATKTTDPLTPQLNVFLPHPSRPMGRPHGVPGYDVPIAEAETQRSGGGWVVSVLSVVSVAKLGRGSRGLPFRAEPSFCLTGHDSRTIDCTLCNDT